ncbi:hypothetical protein OIU85_022288 [Salix viminalis]|uniref:Uncharacterized protein n=1 Tax=Salix viminalis TaxID=40686 RepID=A0A9Q0Z7T8_SALVM|nr:hypothetical protein OIU85_022288 [Salix viminalis]
MPGECQQLELNMSQRTPPAEEITRVNPREMNPNLKDDGRVYPDDGAEKKVGGDHLPSSSLVEDGGASWRLKTETSIVGIDSLKFYRLRKKDGVPLVNSLPLQHLTWLPLLVLICMQ